MSRDLEQWAREVPRALEGMHDSALELVREVGHDGHDRARRDVPRLHDPERTETIRRSLQVRDITDGVTVTSDDPVAEALEEGGTVQGNPFLTIPLRGQVGSARGDGDLFVISGASGLFLASRASGQVELRWKLARSVSMRKRPFIAPAIDAARRDLPERIARRWAEDLVRG